MKVFRLVFIQGFSYREAGSKLRPKKTAKAIERIIYNARKRFPGLDRGYPKRRSKRKEFTW